MTEPELIRTGWRLWDSDWLKPGTFVGITPMTHAETVSLAVSFVDQPAPHWHPWWQPHGTGITYAKPFRTIEDLKAG